MNIKTLPLRLGCAASIIYVIIFFYLFPSRNDSALYVILWIVGFFVLPSVIAIIFRAGSILGVLLSFILNLFGLNRNVNHSKYKADEEYTEAEIINIDEYNTADKKKKDNNEKLLDSDNDIIIEP